MDGKTLKLALGLALLAAGALLLWWGYEESRSLESQLTEIFTGTHPDRVMWKYIGGAVCMATGLVFILRR